MLYNCWKKKVITLIAYLHSLLDLSIMVLKLESIEYEHMCCQGMACSVSSIHQKTNV